MKISHNRLLIDSQCRKSILAVLDSHFIASGEVCRKFEEAVVNYLGGNGHACVVSSGTSAVFLALKALGISPKDKVIIPTYVCSALLNAIYMLGAEPSLVDVDEGDFNISYKEVKKAVTTRTRAIIVPHIYGAPADMGRLRTLGLPIIEDCAQALGAKYQGRRVGTQGDISIFSFYATKLITTGYGGMVYSRHKAYIDKVRDYVDFDYRKKYYPRFNFQMGDIQAALGLSQLKQLSFFLKRREAIASRYARAFLNTGLEFQEMQVAGTRIYYRFVIRTRKPQKLISFLEKSGIRCIIPIEPWELLHRYLKLSNKRFPIAERLAQTTVSLPLYPALKDREVGYIIKTVLKGI